VFEKNFRGEKLAREKYERTRKSKKEQAQILLLNKKFESRHITSQWSKDHNPKWQQAKCPS
jgi:hypothetical protein